MALTLWLLLSVCSFDILAIVSSQLDSGKWKKFTATIVKDTAHQRSEISFKQSRASKMMILQHIKQPPEGTAKPGEERSFDLGGGVKLVMCFIPEGECQLGSTKAERDTVLKLVDEENEPDWLKTESEELRGKFKTSGFWLGKFECTQEQYERLMGNNPSYFDGSMRQKGKGLVLGKLPVEHVSWDDAQDFLAKLNTVAGRQTIFGTTKKFVLPNEDQWEYAYRGGGGNMRAFYWGGILNSDKANHDGRYPFGTVTKGTYLQRPTIVGEFVNQAPHPWGLADMSGNILEWCENWYDNKQKYRILRGGSWRSDAWCCRGANRSGWLEPHYRSESVGFRVCLPLE
jgi:formylglycine-generating enzyme required for sulfatase activity